MRPRIRGDISRIEADKLIISLISKEALYKPKKNKTEAEDSERSY